MSIERMSNGFSQAASMKIRQEATRAIPHISDNTGTAFRIRPQTPKLNLLNKSNYQKNNKQVKLASITDSKAQSI